MRTRTSGSPIVRTDPKADQASHGALAPVIPGEAVSHRCQAPDSPCGAGASHVEVTLPGP